MSADEHKDLKNKDKTDQTAKGRKRRDSDLPRARREALGKLLRKAREEQQKRTQKDLAAGLPFGVSMLSRWEAGQLASAMPPADFPVFLDAYAPSDETTREQIVELYLQSFVWDAYRVHPGTIPYPENEDTASFNRLWSKIMATVWPCPLAEAPRSFKKFKIIGEGFRLERVRLLGFLVGAGVSIFKSAEIIHRQKDFHAWRPLELYQAFDSLADIKRPFPWVADIQRSGLSIGSDNVMYDLGVWSIGFFINVAQRTLASALTNCIMEWCHAVGVKLNDNDMTSSGHLINALGQLKSTLENPNTEEKALKYLTHIETALTSYGSPKDASPRLNYYRTWYGFNRMQSPSLSTLEKTNDEAYVTPECLAEFASIIFGRSSQDYETRREAIREDDMVLVEWLCTYKALLFIGQLVKFMFEDTKDEPVDTSFPIQ